MQCQNRDDQRSQLGATGPAQRRRSGGSVSEANLSLKSLAASRQTAFSVEVTSTSKAKGSLECDIIPSAVRQGEEGALTLVLWRRREEDSLPVLLHHKSTGHQASNDCMRYKHCLHQSKCTTELLSHCRATSCT